MDRPVAYTKHFSMKMTPDQAARLKAEATRQQFTVSELLRRYALTLPKVEVMEQQK